MDYFTMIYSNLKESVIKSERRILKELGFCVHVKHPHKIVITYLQILECEKNKALAQKAWNYMNDSLRTDVFVRFSPEKIACGCIFLAARVLKVVLPTNPPWWELFDADLDDVEEVAMTLLQLYLRPKRSLNSLEHAVSKVKKSIQERKDAHADSKSSGSFTPAHSSPADTLPQPATANKKVSPLTISPSKSRPCTADDKMEKPDSKSNGSSTKSRSLESNKKHQKRRRPESYRTPESDKQRTRSESRSPSGGNNSHSSASADSSPDAKSNSRAVKSRSGETTKNRSPSYSESSESDDAQDNDRLPRTYKQRPAEVAKRQHPRYRDTSRNGDSRKDFNDRSRSPRRRERSRSRSRSRDRKNRKRGDYPANYPRKSSKHRNYDNDARAYPNNYSKYDRKGKR